VVGAGSAGATLAARLSEDASRRVLLIEAGRDTAPGQVPADIRNVFPAAYINGEYFWPGLTTSYRKGEAPIPFLQPRVMGGGSSVMGMIALRGLPTDYDAWEQMGARNWGWGDVLPTFQAMTDDHDAAGPERNVRGPNIVRRLPRASWPAYMRRLEEVLVGQGMPSHANIYDTDEDRPAQPGSRTRHQRALLSHRRGAGAAQPRRHVRHARAAHSVRRPTRHRRSCRARRCADHYRRARSRPVGRRHSLAGGAAALGHRSG